MNLEELIKEYKDFTPTSSKLHKQAMTVLPGGVSANIKYFAPYPIFMKSAKGAYLTDVDDNDYIDYLGSYGPLILGHCNPIIEETMKEQFEKGILYGTPSEVEYEFAKKIQQFYPSIEMLRYTNSGTEATLLSLRLAYAFTNKFKIGKFEGHYHGGYNQVLISVNPPVSEAGDIKSPKAIPETKGLEPYQTENTIVLPFNDLQACTKILEEHQDEMAAVIMEPILGGYVVATHEFMTGLREVTKRLGILLIFDEVKTGFRSALGGAQELYNIKPDITALGKVIGAGMPMGIVGGRKDIIMTTSPAVGSDIFDSSTSKRSAAKDVLFHSGTYNGHPLILKAGIATINILEKEFENIVKNTNSLRKQLVDLFKSYGINILTVGEGAMFNYCITELEAITCYRDVQQSNFDLRKRLDFALFKEGIYNKPLNRFNLSLYHDKEIIDKTLQAFDNAFKKVL
ncbi:glutamate-1-semialdehyde 2,1-aminomutase [Candidatus Epulonipiscium fishelsonii]|uniref:Glutamate-1-semialdehyde 2,1-aminomutase n=1 Tax=Candidatus Epulonipiscium fishelsonii TaxID=77094 RepID=A0ACC8X7M3_9FIRM|nr:glutamate-1-semialdehyde 2,1-aminomutase [Epulopiscium sp. SCG-B11WGA-EpuloA1]